MSDSAVPSWLPEHLVIRGQDLLPGIAVALALAMVSVAASVQFGEYFTLPAMLVALLIGMMLNPVAQTPALQPGLTFCVKRLLRIAVALLGVRIALSDIGALGFSAAILIMVSMSVTVGAAILLTRAFGQSGPYGALAGVATAVCGASAALATATVLPAYKNKQADTAFVIVAVNALSTVAMLLYPVVCVWLDFDERATGLLLGGTIHDVAQVVGSGYSVSDNVGDSAVIVKMFRVFLLLPVVLVVGYAFARRGADVSAKAVPVPVFAIAFVGLCILNSILMTAPGLSGIYGPVKAVLVWAATWGLLVAIAALGLGTSVSAIRQLGWRHMVIVVATTLVILLCVTLGLLAGA